MIDKLQYLYAECHIDYKQNYHMHIHVFGKIDKTTLEIDDMIFRNAIPELLCIQIYN